MKSFTGKKIVIASHGFVFIGDVSDPTKNGESGKDILITNAACIRVWGTTKGLGELAISGPTKETILDSCYKILIPSHSIVGIMDCK